MNATVQSQIRRYEIFNQLSASEMDRLLHYAEIREYPKGTELFREGDPADRFSILLSGQTEIILSLGTPEEKILTVLEPGEFLGEIGLLHPDQKRTASARTLTDSRHFEILKRDFEILLQNTPSIALRLAQEMSSRIHKSELATIQDLQRKNQRLESAYQELKEMQEQLIEQEKLELELELARTIQEKNFLRELPNPKGWIISAHWHPAQAVSGDFYDFLQYSNDQLKFLIADVVGKGVPAALVAATSRSILHTLMTQDIPPAQVLATANDLLVDETPDKFFITCFYAEVDLEQGWVRYANAGHCLPFLITENQQQAASIGVLKAVGMPLGALPGSHYDQKEAQIEPGDRLILYSDGLIEAHNRDGEMFSQERVTTYLRNFASQKPAFSSGFTHLVDGLLNEVSQFIGDASAQEDDLTCLYIERAR